MDTAEHGRRGDAPAPGRTRSCSLQPMREVPSAGCLTSPCADARGWSNRHTKDWACPRDICVTGVFASTLPTRSRPVSSCFHLLGSRVGSTRTGQATPAGHGDPRTIFHAPPLTTPVHPSVCWRCCDSQRRRQAQEPRCPGASTASGPSLLQGGHHGLTTSPTPPGRPTTVFPSWFHPEQATSLPLSLRLWFPPLKRSSAERPVPTEPFQLQRGTSSSKLRPLGVPRRWP